MKKTLYIAILLSSFLLAGCSLYPESKDVVDNDKGTDTTNEKDIVVVTDTEQALTGEDNK